MLTKTSFVKLITSMKDQRDIDREATDALQSIFDDVGGGFYNNESLYSAIEELIISEFKDTGDWLRYWLYDLEFGSGWNTTTCSEKDGTVIDISTTEKLYDFLIKNMEQV